MSSGTRLHKWILGGYIGDRVRDKYPTFGVIS